MPSAWTDNYAVLRAIQLKANDEQTLTLQGLPLDTKLVEAKLSVQGGDANYLAADDTAWALRPVPPNSNVLLVTTGNGFLEKSLGLLPGVKLFKSAPDAYAPSDGFRLTVLDAFMPKELPTGNLLIFAPPEFAPGAGIGHASLSRDWTGICKRPPAQVCGPLEGEYCPGPAHYYAVMG